MPETIQYRLVVHNAENRIAIDFAYNSTLIVRIKKVAGVKWSQTMRCWHIPDTPDNRFKCKLTTQQPVAVTVALLTATSPNTNYKPPTYTTTMLPAARPLAVTGKMALAFISSHNAVQMRIYIEHLQLHGYRASTIKTYRNEFAQLLQILAHANVEDLLPGHLRRYFVFCVGQGLSENTLHSRLNAIKYYYEQVLHRQKVFFDIPRPKKPLLLPKVLNNGELGRLFNALQNKKHKAILFTP